jgi:hypothetical protein
MYEITGITAQSFRKQQPIKKQQGKTSHNNKKQANKNLIYIKRYYCTIDIWIRIWL